MSALADRREGREVLRRHKRAMNVVGQVDDENARFALLEYVLLGSERIDEAMQMSAGRPGIELRHRSALELRNDGLSYSEIARQLGYAHPMSAHGAVRAAIRKAA